MSRFGTLVTMVGLALGPCMVRAEAPPPAAAEGKAQLEAAPAAAAEGKAQLEAPPPATGEGKGNPMVLFTTSLGDIKIELFPDKAPVTVKNFLEYVQAGYYDGTVFHRVIPGFMIQGGGMDGELHEKPGLRPAIKNEAGNGLLNATGSVAMARTSVPDSATSQFFINTVDNDFLNREKAADGVGYAVFGKVVEGMDVVKKIEGVKTGSKGPHQNVPVEPVVIQSAKVVTATK